MNDKALKNAEKVLDLSFKDKIKVVQDKRAKQTFFDHMKIGTYVVKTNALVEKVPLVCKFYLENGSLIWLSKKQIEIL